MARQDLEALRRRRRQAVRLFAKGETQAQVARLLGVSRQTAMVWWRRFEQEGAAALREPGVAGRPARLEADAIHRVEQALLDGPQAQGYATDLWTLPRVATVIERVTGVSYHTGHVWRILRKLGWSRQKPTTRARERDEAAIQRWVHETWPRLKKTPLAAEPRSSSSTRAGSRNDPPFVVRGRRAVRRPS
jgi:transposase